MAMTVETATSRRGEASVRTIRGMKDEGRRRSTSTRWITARVAIDSDETLKNPACCARKHLYYTHGLCARRVACALIVRNDPYSLSETRLFIFIVNRTRLHNISLLIKSRLNYSMKKNREVSIKRWHKRYSIKLFVEFFEYFFYIQRRCNFCNL